jgi:hypothetical protein
VRNFLGTAVSVLLAACAARPSPSVVADAPAPGRDWAAIVAGGYVVPDDCDAFTLCLELSASLGAADPVLRDDHAYGILAQWIVNQHRLSGEQLRELSRLWRVNLLDGLGQVGTDAVLLRSFSALSLALVATEDVRRPFLAPGEVRELLDAALHYLKGEQDLRDYDRTKGWIHATAHTADLLKFLARNPRVDAAGLRAILDGIAAKLAVPMDGAFRMGEDERLARVLVSAVLRKECDEAMFDTFLASLSTSLAGARDHQPFDPAHFAIEQNVLHCLRALHAVLVSAGPLPPQAERARDAVTEWLGAAR